MGSNLLYKASIVTTPTAYGVGVLNSIKPAQSFGEELIVNGNFDTDSSNWLLTGSSFWINSSIEVPTGGLTQAFTLKNSITYKITFDVIQGSGINGGVYVNTNYNSPVFADNVGITTTGVGGTYTFTFTMNGNGNGITLTRRVNNQDIRIDNVSVVEVTDADFQFSRNSSATRVNPDYLIETVSINSANLVQNGNFSELSSQLITNGDFATDSDWSLTQATIINGAANISTTGSLAGIVQSSVTTSGKTYKFNIEITNIQTLGSGISLTSGGLTSSILNTFTTLGTHTVYFTATSTTIGIKRTTGATDITIDNVSVKQVDPNDNWTLGTGTTFGNNLVNITQGGNVLEQSGGVFVSGKKFKIQYTISNYVSGSIAVSNVSPTTYFNSNGIYSYDVVGAGGNFKYFSNGFVGSITDISVIEIQENGVPRLDYTNGTASILLEPQSTNLIPYSEDFSQWNKQGSTLTVNQIISPDGNTKGSLLQSTSTSVAVIEPSGLSLTIGVTYTYTVFVKKSNSQWIRLAHISSSATGCWFDLENGVVGIVNSESAKIDEYPNGWYRISNTFVATSVSTSNSAFIGICDNDGSTNAGAIGQNVYIYGAQLEALSYPTSYIPTSGQSGGVTRAAETLNNAANSDLINSTEGVLYAEISALANGGVGDRYISLGSGSSQNTIQLLFHNTANRVNFRLTKAGSLEVNISDFTFLQTDDLKIACKFKENDFALWINGVERVVDTSGETFSVNTLQEIQFDSGTGASNFYGKCKTVAVFSEALSDTELACLTSTNNREIFLNYYYRMQYVGANTEAVNCAQIKLNV